MKKNVILVCTLMLAIGLFSGKVEAAAKKKAATPQAKEVWYVMDGKSGDFECEILENGLNPEKAKMVGATVTDNGKGFFTIDFEGKKMFWFNSKKSCEIAGEAIKSGKN